MVSVLKNHRPDLIYIHCDCTELYGDNWHRVQAIANRTGTRLTVRPIEIPTQVFGKNLSEGWRLWHASDVSRLQVLQEFGGIYLDRDVYVIKPFNEFFKYEMTIDFESQNTLGSQVLIGHKNARFLRLCYETFRDYDPTKWYVNIGERPVLNVINKQPHIIHRMDGQFGVRPNVCHMLYPKYDKNWRNMLKNHRPDLIYIHCDCTELSGDNWHRVQAIANWTGTRLTVRPIEMPTQVFGRNLSERWLLWHASDVTRIQVLREFGGIYLDRDVYVIKSLNEFFKYEMTIDFQSKNELGSQVLIAHKNSRFLRLFYESFIDYDPNQWYTNIGIRPVLNIINKQPHLIHRMDGQFGVRPNVCPMLYTEYDENWRNMLKNHRPDLIYIHCDCTELYGDNWHRVQAIANRTGTRLTVRS
ncbi:unnamed protein product, partial [Oppiella nova]